MWLVCLDVHNLLYNLFIFMFDINLVYLLFQRDFNISRRAAKAAHRKSLITTTSPTLPRCHSPLSGMYF